MKGLVVLWWTITSTTNWFYGIVSGWLGDVALLGAVIHWWRHSQCHVDGCRRHGKYAFEQYKLCRQHHPDVPQRVTHLHIIKKHKEIK